MPTLPFTLSDIAPSFFNPEEHVFTLKENTQLTESTQPIEEDPRIVHKDDSPILFPEDFAEDPSEDSPQPNTVLSDSPIPDVPPNVLIDEAQAFSDLRMLEQELLLSDANLSTTEFQTLTIIDHNQSFKFFDIPKQSRRQFLTLLNSLREQGSIIKLCDDAERTRDLSNLTKTHLQIISDNSHRLYNHKSPHLKDKPILLPSDAFHHIKKQLEEQAKLSKLSKKIASSEEIASEKKFKSAYTDWIEVCRKLKLERHTAESELLSRKAKLMQELTMIRDELRTISERFVPPPAPQKSEFL